MTRPFVLVLFWTASTQAFVQPTTRQAQWKSSRRFTVVPQQQDWSSSEPQQALEAATNEFLAARIELEQANSDAKFVQDEAQAAVERLTDQYTEKVPSMRQLTSFLSTTCLIWLSEPLLSLVDTTVVGWTQASSVVQLAAMGPATTLMDTLLYLTYFLAIATTNQLAEQLADDNVRALQQTTSRLLGVALVAGGMVWMSTVLLGPTVLAAMAGASAKQSPTLVPLAAGYTWIRASVAPLSVAGMVAQAFCLVTGHTSSVAQAVGLASVTNILGDLLLTPRFGMYGAAAATALASSASALLLLRRVHQQMKQWRAEEIDRAQEDPWPAAWRSNSTLTALTQRSTLPPTPASPVPLLSLPDRQSMGALIKLSLPLAFNMLAKMGSYSALTVRATAFGPVALAAQNILMRVFYFLCCLADSLGQASQAFLPAAIYPRFDKSAYRRILAKLGGVAVVAAIGGSLVARLLLQGKGAALLAKDAGIVAQATSAGPFLAASLFLHPFITTVEGSVIANRDFGNLFKTYSVTLAVFVGLLKFASPSLALTWRALVWWQVSRLVNSLVWRKRAQGIDIHN